MAATTKLIVASLLATTMLAGIPMTAFAQSDGDKKVSLELEQVDVREALRALFKSTGFSYSIAPEVQGLVTVNLHEVAFPTALQNILKQVSATYRVEAGVYQVVNREDPIKSPDNGDLGQTHPGSNKTRRRVTLRSADPMFVATIIGKENTNFSLAPEMSTVLKTPGGSGNGGGFNGFGGSSQGNSSGSNGGFNNGGTFGSGTSSGRGNGH
jgi:type II secretory pathway component GspD/PulD (secretin)